MRKHTPHALLLAVLAVAIALPAHAAQDDPIEVLKSDASYQEKQEACRTLSRRAGPEAVPALKPLLKDEKLSHMARYALERIPGTEADRALREMLGQTTGDIRAGIIKSLEVRRDKDAIPQLIDLLDAEDPVVAGAAARALGRFNTPEATQALEEAAGQTGLSEDKMHAFADGLLSAAEALSERGDTDRAADIYEGLLDHPDAPQVVRTGALRGLAVTLHADAMDRVVEALHSDNERMFGAGIRAAREMGDGADVSEELAAELPDLSELKQVRLLQALGERGHKAAGPAIMELAEEGATDVRVAALKALTRIGYEDALGLMQEMAWQEEGKLADAARDSLAYFPTPAGDEALKDMLGHQEAEARQVAIRLIRQGGLPEPAAALMDVVEEDESQEVRLGALNALRQVAGADEVPGLLDVLMGASSEQELQAAEAALRAVCGREKRRTEADVKVTKAVYGVLPDGASADVTQKVRNMVKEGSLEITASNGNFGDPAQGEQKKLRIDYTVNGASASKTVDEGQTLTLTRGTVPSEIVDQLNSAVHDAEGDAKKAVIRILTAAGGPEALKTLRSVISYAEGDMKDTALRALCDWPTPEALPAIMGLVQEPPNGTIKALAIRGAVRLLRSSPVQTGEMLEHYSMLMGNAESAGNRKTVLSGLATVPHPRALDMALSEMDDADVRAEAQQAATSIAKKLGENARVEQDPFDEENLDEWPGSSKYWHSENGTLVGSSDEPVPSTGYLFAPGTAADFHLVARVKLEPDTGNSGIQFRSEMRENEVAVGPQADVGKNVWGRLYDQGGRGKLDWTGTAEEAVKPGEWNRLEVLAVGPAIWTAINGRLGVRCLHLDGPRSGRFAFQFHQGPPQTVRIRVEKLVHNPPIELAGKGAEELIKALEIPE